MKYIVSIFIGIILLITPAVAQTPTIVFDGAKISGNHVKLNGIMGTTIGRLSLTNFTWINQGSSTAVDNSPGPLSLQCQQQSGDLLRALVVPLPTTTPWTVTTLFRPMAPNINYTQSGLGLYSTTGRVVTFHLLEQSGSVLNIGISEYNSSTSFNSSPVLNGFIPSFPIFLRIIDDGTNLNFYYSLNGATSSWVLLYTQAVTSWLPDIQYVGISCNNNNGGVPYLMDVWGFELTTGEGTNTTWP